MKYVSTRTGSGPDAPAVGFLEAILSGLAPDGGLYVPEVWPELSHAEIAAFVAAGFTRAQALDVVLAVGLKTMSNYVNHLAETPLDPPFANDAQRIAIALAALALAGPLMTPTLAAAAKPAVYTPALNNVAVGGYDTVAYFTQGKPVRGVDAFQTDWRG
eukprot:gene32223-32946_t